ncbi:MAG TPA: hypothetical protein VFV79_01030 [Saprospiraceae bacterium]|nr:hypothetical protein [Saprospiraceae bacterium]
MKNIKLIISLSFALLFVSISCNDDDFVQYGNEQYQKVTDPYLQIITPVISFQAGVPSYHMEFIAVNGLKRITDVLVYKTFTDAATGLTSNEALLDSYPLTADATTTVTDELTYAKLKEGLTINGNPLPDNEVDIAIGSGWQFRFVGVSPAGDIPLAGTIRVGVLSRFAGLYKVIESSYYRIGVLTANWTGQTRFIGSVDATTFSYNDYWGYFPWGGHSFRFVLDESDNSLDVPVLVNGEFYAGNRAIGCSTDFALFTNVPCDGSNILIPDDTNGKHILKLTYGYFVDGSGAREFYEVLEKI